MTNKSPAYQPNKHFVEWLDSGRGRAAALHRADKQLIPPMISKFKHGVNPISITHAIRIERAQQQIPKSKPIKAEKIVTSKADAELIRYLREGSTSE